MQQAWREPRRCGGCGEFHGSRRALLAGVEAPGWCVQCSGPVRPEAPACPVFEDGHDARRLGGAMGADGLPLRFGERAWCPMFGRGVVSAIVLRPYGTYVEAEDGERVWEELAWCVRHEQGSGQPPRSPRPGPCGTGASRSAGWPRSSGGAAAP